jgi:hypothetical protein
MAKPATAKALEIAFAPSLLRQADEVIRQASG